MELNSVCSDAIRVCSMREISMSASTSLAATMFCTPARAS
jgi:hypothetical protein